MVTTVAVPKVRCRRASASVATACYLLVHAAQGLVHDYIIHPPPDHVDRTVFVAELVRLLGGYLAGTRRPHR